MYNFPLAKGARGMFRPHGITCPMKHPPAPLHKGETFIYWCIIKADWAGTTTSEPFTRPMPFGLILPSLQTMV